MTGGEVDGGETLERIVVWGEDCDVGEVFEGCDEVGEVYCGQGGEDAEGGDEEFVDDVDYCLVEFEVLQWFVRSADIAHVEKRLYSQLQPSDL